MPCRTASSPVGEADQLTLTTGDSPKEAQRLCLTLTSKLWAHNHRAELRTAPLPK